MDHPPRILIADDDPDLLELLRDFLIGQGYEVAAVATGAEVLDAVVSIKPEVIVVDMVLPDLFGADVLAALRRDGLTMPVILISGHQIVVREGFFGAFRKPFHFRRLAEVVAAAVKQGRTSGG